MKNKNKKQSLLALAALTLPMLAHAANVSLTGADPGGTTSFNAPGKWSNAQAPSAANDYFTSAFFMRTPASLGSTTWTFGGNSLTLQQPTASGVRSFINKSGNNDTFVINNFTNAFGGILENGGAGGVVANLSGNLWTIAGNSAVVGNQGSWIINSPLAGASGVILTNAGGNGGGITYNGDLSAFKGKFYISLVNFGNGGGPTRVILNGATSVPGNPTTLTPDQFLLEAGCTLQDNVGLTFNNANGGITLAGNATINAAATTVMAEPITGAFTLTNAGAGTLRLNTAGTYTGGTVVSGGTLQLGAANVLPAGTVTVNASLDLNGFNVSMNSLSGSGTVDNFVGGTSAITLGSNNASGTFSGVIQNSVGIVSLTKIGTGTQTLSGGYTYSGATVVAGGRLNVTAGSVPGAAGNLTVSNGAALTFDVSAGTTMPAQNVVVGPNGSLGLTLNSAITGLNVAGSLSLQNNATNVFNYGTLSANPTATAINVAGSLTAPGTGVVFQITGSGLQAGTFTLINYTGTALANLANITLVTPPGVTATLVNNTANTSIDLNISFVTKNVSWYGAAGAAWDFTTSNWRTNGVNTIYQQYTNGPLIVGDGALFDDTLFNDFINPQPTNINLTTTFYPYPLLVNSTLPYSFAGSGSLAGTTALVKSNTGSLTLNTANSYTGGTFIYGGSVVVNSDSALGAAGVGVTLGDGTLQFAGSTTSTRPVTITTPSSIGVAAAATAQLSGNISSSVGLTKIDNGTLDLTGNNTATGTLSVNAGTLSISGGSATFAGNPSYVAYQTGSATLSLSGSSTLNSAGELRVGGSDQNGTGFNATGTFNVSGGNAYLSALTLARGNNFENPCFGAMTVSGGTVWCTNDLQAGFAGSGTGTLNISGTGTLNLGPAATKWFILGQWDTSQGNINVSGGNLNLMNNTCIKFSPGNGVTSGTNVFTLSGGTITCYSDGGTNVGGTGDLNLAQSGSAAARNTFNLDGGTLIVPQIGSASTTPTRAFNFNGGTLKAAKANGTFMNLGSGNAVANVRNGGAIIDDGGFNITIAQALVHSTIAGDNATDGGLTKNGAGSLSLSGANTFNGPAAVNAGSLLMTTASALAGNVMISNNATLTIAQVGSATKTTGNLTFNGAVGTPGATLGLALTAANVATTPVINCGTLTLNGDNSISLAGAVNVGTIQLIKTLGVVAGSGNVTNLLLPQGAAGTISTTFDGTYTTISATITSTGPGLVWTGGANNLWDINTSTNWLISSTATKYQQTIIPGDAVTFTDAGSGTVIANTSVGPASLTISNNSTAYTFSGNGSIAGPTGLLKLGSGSATLNLTNNSFSGDVTVNGGALQFGVASGIPSGGNLIVGTNGTVQLAGLSLTVKELTGSGKVDNSAGLEMLLTIGSSTGGTWNGTVTNTGGGVALRKTGVGTWVVGGPNYFDNGQPFSFWNQINQGTVIITNGGLINSAYLQMQIANLAGQTGAVVVAGGTLRVADNVLSVGYGGGATGTLTVNSGTVQHSGPASGLFAAVPNSIDVGAQGATGTLIVHGGQVLNDLPLYLGDGATSTGILYLNGGLVRASALQPNGTPASSIAYFNGGTLQAATNSADFIVAGTTPLIQTGGLVLDDGGYAVGISSQGLQEDPASTGGGLTKQGSGTLYLDAGNSYTGTTLVTNGILAGVGSIAGPMVVAPTGKLGAGDAPNVGSFSVNNNLTIQGGAFMRIDKTGGSPLQDQVVVSGNVTYGGGLTVSNITSDATTLVIGDSFQLFNVTGSKSANFSSLAGSPGTGMAYSFDPATGILSVVAFTGPTGPATLTNTVTGTTLHLSWPAGQGWRLQQQTNSLTAGLGNNWVYVTDSSVSNTNITINSTSPVTFFRLVYP